jgi:hypothetical protein
VHPFDRPSQCTSASAGAAAGPHPGPDDDPRRQSLARPWLCADDHAPVAAQGSEAYKDGSEPTKDQTFYVFRFAQVLWRSTKRVGCASKMCRVEDIVLGDIFGPSYLYVFYVVCYYDPPGNVLGQYRVNLLRTLPLPPPAKRPPPPPAKRMPPPLAKRPPPPLAKRPPPPPALSPINQAWLKAHNMARILPGSGNLTWDAKLEAAAAAMANKCLGYTNTDAQPGYVQAVLETDKLDPISITAEWLEEVRVNASTDNPSHFTAPAAAVQATVQARILAPRQCAPASAAALTRSLAWPWFCA